MIDNTALLAEAPTTGESYSDLGVAGSGQIATYIVRPGDTLGAIGKMFGVSVNTIVWANDITGGIITPGQSLVILPISGVKHIVVKGDTLDSIAKKYKADVGDLRSFNGLALNAKLAAGDVVIVPDGELVPVVRVVTASPSASNTINSSGYYIKPVPSAVKTQGLHGHNGIDLGGVAPGTPILAAADGTVIVARTTGYNGGYGLYVVIAHANGTQTLYGHMLEVDVTVGEKVDQGEIIGKLGNSGKTTGPHLHFEVRGARNPF